MVLVYFRVISLALTRRQTKFRAKAPGKASEPLGSRTICRRNSQAGFSLIEVLIALAIIGLVASLVGPRVVGYLGASKTKTARVQIESIVSALQLYRLDVGRYPTTAEGLKALIEKGATANWSGPYLTKSEIPLDPWGRPFNYRSPGQHGEFDVFSLGADNQPGGDGENADVNSWQR